ncbi:MAG: type II toxin-antitoxin system Phd/YefM family antitoxin [Myxococcales bacterium]
MKRSRENVRRIGLADFKAHLSAYVRRVRGGLALTLLDRDRPVARVVPCEDREGPLVVRPARRPLRGYRPPPPLGRDVGSLEALREERTDR